MTLPQPNLDDKTFAALVAEATKLIPRHAPEWTDHNRHDPGITFVELFSWLAEMQQFYLNRVGEESHLKFLKLLGIKPRRATQARADVSFAGATGEGLVVPRGTKLTTAEGLTFETEEALRVVEAALTKVLSSSKSSLKDNTDANGISGLSFYAFGEEAGVGRRLYVGLDRELPPGEEVFLTIGLYEGYRVACGSHGDEPAAVVPSALVGWEYYEGSDWKPLEIVAEIEAALAATGGGEAGGTGCFKLKESFLGRVRSSFAYRHLAAEARKVFDDAAGEAGTARELRRSLYDTPFLLLKGDETLMLSQSGRLRFTAPPTMAARVVHPFEDNLYWLRATVLGGTYELPPRIETIRLNTVSAAQRDTAGEVISFTSDGRPGQSFEAEGFLALVGTNFVQVREHDGSWKDWEAVGEAQADLGDSGPNDEHYVIRRDERAAKVFVRFGDGFHGRIPTEGAGAVRLVSYLPAFEEPRILGRSVGLPNQSFTLRQTPVIPETFLIQVAERTRPAPISTETTEIGCLLSFARAREFVGGANKGPKLCEVRLTLEAKQEICNVEVRERLRGALRFLPERGSRCDASFGTSSAVFSIGRMRAGEVLVCNYFVGVGEVGGNIHGEVIISLAAACPTIMGESPTSVVEGEPGREEVRWRDWTRVDDFDASGPEDPHFVLDASAGAVRFGDGVNGDIPPAPASETEENIRVISFQSGGGEGGNVSAAAVSAFAIPYGVESDPRLLDLSVSNHAAAEGGLGDEELEDAQARARRDLKTQYRGVTDEDVEYLALNTPGLRVARARAIPLFAPGLRGYPAAQSPASVTVVVVPYSPSLRPFPSEGFVRTVCRHLDRHRLLTTRVHVIGPEYVGVGVGATVRLFAEFGQTETLARIRRSLDNFLRPLPAEDDPEGVGWPFGRTVFRSEIYQLIENVEGVDCVEKVTLSATGVGVSRGVEGNILIPPQSLVYPGEHSIDIVSPRSECRSTL